MSMFYFYKKLDLRAILSHLHADERQRDNLFVARDLGNEAYLKMLKQIYQTSQKKWMAMDFGEKESCFYRQLQKNNARWEKAVQHVGELEKQLSKADAFAPSGYPRTLELFQSLVKQFSHRTQCHYPQGFSHSQLKPGHLPALINQLLPLYKKDLDVIENNVNFLTALDRLGHEIKHLESPRFLGRLFAPKVRAKPTSLEMVDMAASTVVVHSRGR